MPLLRTSSRATQLPLTCAFSLLLCALLIQATPTPSAEVSSIVNDTKPDNCPADCECVLARHTHSHFLHAKCSSLEGLRSYAPEEDALPIHSLDLSYLNLKRLSHPLEKLPDVTSIDLSHNELHEIGHLGRRIKKLNLKHNRITSSKLTKLPAHLQVLNLQHNDITNLPLEFKRLSNLETLELSHNQINCSCETLEVRNWLQERHVFMEHAITCTYPTEVQGKPWLQVKQSDICAREKSGRLLDEEDNELMMGDQPVEGSGDQDDEDELGKAFIPLDKASTVKTSAVQLDAVEGSGDLSDVNAPVNLVMTTLVPAVESSQEQVTTDAAPLPIEQEEEEEDGSGSGDGLLIIPNLARGPLITDDFEAPDDDDTDDAFDNKPLEQPTSEEKEESHKHAEDIFGVGMGIFDTDANGAEQTEVPTEVKAEAPVTEEVIVPIVQHNAESENVPDVNTEGYSSGEASAILTASAGGEPKDDSSATYFLLGVLGLIVVGLILFVGIKRCKHNRNAAHDAENPRQTELLDMDKKNLGKPLRNGNEHAPLIGDQTKLDLAKPINGTGQKKPYDANDVKDGPGQQQPLLKGSNGAGANEQVVNKENAPPATEATAPHEYHPITPRYPTPKSPRASKYAQYPPQGTEHNNNNDDSYLPSSPKSGRYSPVYSPETGRVKIKLTETPRPKTPMLVTRSKSNAGDIITTPVVATNGIDNTLTVPGIHAPTATLVNGH